MTDEIPQYIGKKFNEFTSTVSKNLLGYSRISEALFVSMLLNKHILLEGLPASARHRS